MLRVRLAYVVAALLTIAVGLVVHHGGVLSGVARDIAGDALWAMMVTWWVSALVPGRPLLTRAAIALGIAWAVELTQLYHAPWIDALRSSRLVHLVLGSDFDARDLVSYAAGVALGALMDFAVRRRRQAGTA